MFKQFTKALRSTRLQTRSQHTIPKQQNKMRLGAIVGTSVLVAAILAQQSPLLADAKKPVKPVEVKSHAGVQGGIERTFIAVKPDGTQRGLVGKIIQRFEEKGYKLVGLKAIVPSRALAEIHYADLKARPFFKGLVDYMTSGKGPDVIKQGRRIIGATNPLQAEPGTIRGDYCISVGRNIIHGSDSFESANIEIPLWFGSNEVYDWEFGNAEWVISQN
ncbi:hypothetical protein HK103_006814 [Boothiomyces macroporosus]|uniref:Nucleoside diphosphate kinase n=1 Tax=Boothiomyces macroporosus TaxID=261099 RepID=A0AAD5UGW0_9FUNG|nr:hypothetical protein HK103_006814 [Boothiomyces macroporosus]